MAKFEEADERWIVRERDDGTNVNGWHWTNKDLSARGTALLKASLEELQISLPFAPDAATAAAGGAGAALLRVSLSGVTVTGSVEALNRKGRRFLIYELDISADWRATLEPPPAPVSAGPAASVSGPGGPGSEAAAAPGGGEGALGQTEAPGLVAGAGEDDEALARRLQAEEDEAASAALLAREASAAGGGGGGSGGGGGGTRAGFVKGTVRTTEWSQDEEDEPSWAVERTGVEPFPPLGARAGAGDGGDGGAAAAAGGAGGGAAGGAVAASGVPVSTEHVFASARKALLSELGAALKAWARRVRDEGTGPAAGAGAAGAVGAAGATVGAGAAERARAAPAVPSSAPAAKPAARPTAPAPVAAPAGPVAVLHDAADALRDALAAYCARAPSAGARAELSLRSLRLTAEEVGTLARFLREAGAGASGGGSDGPSVLDLSDNELGDEGCEALAEALAQGGGAAALATLKLGGNRTTGEGEARVASALRASRPRLVVSWERGGPGEAAAAVSARALCSVGTVHAGSPAAEAGLQEGDKLVKAGPIDAASYVSIEESLVPLIRAHKGRGLTVEVLRQSAGSALPSRLRLSLLPHEWSGNGLLGCVLHPLF